MLVQQQPAGRAEARRLPQDQLGLVPVALLVPEQRLQRRSVEHPAAEVQEVL